MDNVLVRGTAEVQSQGGKIISYAGDNLIAVFGGVVAREDAAKSAVKAGLVLVDIRFSLHDQMLELFKLDDGNVRVGKMPTGVRIMLLWICSRVALTHPGVRRV